MSFFARGESEAPVGMLVDNSFNKAAPDDRDMGNIVKI